MAMLGVLLAAGLTGLLARPLRHVLTWTLLAGMLVAGWPRVRPRSDSWFGFFFTVGAAVAFNVPNAYHVNVFATPLILSWLVSRHSGISRRLLASALWATVAFSIWRFLCSTVPAVWLLADRAGMIMAQMAGRLVQLPLNFGPTFAGVNVLVLMLAWYAAWLLQTSTPRLPRALWAAGGLIVAQIFQIVAVGVAAERLAQSSSSTGSANAL
ncbi:MAG: hypothetical protein ACUVWX_11340 [Kiritimatiellia bacterium]